MSYFASFLGGDGFGTYQVDWSSSPPSFERISRPPDVLLIPGFVDIHIHGAFGIDFMSASPSELGVLAEKLEAVGYESFLPTTVTCSAGDAERAISRLPDHPAIAGFHLEGPFISKEHPGAQPPHFIVDPPQGPSEWDGVLDDPRLKVITLAPERPGALELISRLNSRGVAVGLGHTDATFEEARRGFEFGASHTTHTFNAMRGFHHREAGAAGYALASDGLATELIYDRLHVSPDAARLLIKCKPEHKVVAVSDSTMATGMPPNLTVEMWGHKCITGKGEVRLADGGALAGSAITLYDAFQNLAENFGTETAIRACCLNPRRIIGASAPPRLYIEMN
ncbi:MAG TPA: amidohydrolase family protein, partial [Fimbriimonadaceae bacterium]|nr:amidohydrolase family protein [Fimbriimonadaceae bacterium]